MPIEHMFAKFRRDDLIPVPEIAVPVAIPEQYAIVGLLSAATPKETAIGDLVLISYFYLLRVGEYTKNVEKATVVPSNSDGATLPLKWEHYIGEGCSCIRNISSYCCYITII